MAEIDMEHDNTTRYLGVSERTGQFPYLVCVAYGGAI